MKRPTRQSTWLLVTLLVALMSTSSLVKAQLTSDQELELNETEQLINSFFKGFGIEDISNKYYTCLYD